MFDEKYYFIDVCYSGGVILLLLILSGFLFVGYIVGFVVDLFGFVVDFFVDYGVEDVVGFDVVGMDELYVFVYFDYFEWVFVIDCDLIVKGGEFEVVFGDVIIVVEGDEWW